MIHTTIGALLDGTLADLDTTDHHLYVVRDGDVVFYVGKSQDVIDRLRSHVGKGTWGHMSGRSSLGRLIEDNLPGARHWQIELLTPSECGVEPIIVKGVTKEGYDGFNKKLIESGFGLVIEWDESMLQEKLWYNDTTIAKAEELLISYHHPCLNASLNRNPNALPERYKRDNAEAAGRAMLAAFGVLPE